MEALKQQIENSRKIFKEKMLECEVEDGDTLMCSINQAFGEFHINGHNCLGCNLQEDVDWIESFLEQANAENYFVAGMHIEYFFKTYLFHLYLLTEKIFEIKKIIGLPLSYKENEFEIFRTIKLWSNFFKHPKAFILTHHPKYFFDNDLEVIEKLGKNNDNKIIDLKFIKKYYSGEDQNKYKNLTGELRNNINVKVIIPSIDILTKDFCNACAIFIEVIKENKAYKEILNDLTTLENYFDYELDIE
jgi:hypothetical protein